MENNSFKKTLQQRFNKLSRQRDCLQSQLTDTRDDTETIGKLKEIRSLDNERFRIFKQIGGAA